MNRRSFLKVAVAASAVASLIPIPARLFGSGLVLWGDGLHDDTAALQAVLNGRRDVVIMCPDNVIDCGRSVRITHGHFLVKGRIDLTEASRRGFAIDYNRFDCAGTGGFDFAGPPVPGVWLANYA